MNTLDQEKQRIARAFDAEFSGCNLRDDKSQQKVERYIRDFLTKSLDALHAAVVREVVNKLKARPFRPAERTVQLGVVAQGTPAGKLHYAREYGKSDGYKEAIGDIISLLSAPNKDKEE